MNPAGSIIAFTTASGAGFGLLLLLGLGAPLGLLPESGLFAFVALACALALAASGLAASVLHLGRPERSWRAFSQWRSSWLSREGVCAVATFLPTAFFGVGWVFFGATRGLIGLCGFIAAALAAVTILCTGMIYASLKPVHQWHNHWVVPGYLALGLMSGLLILDFLIRFWIRQSTGLALFTFAVIIAAWWIKERYWLFVATSAPIVTMTSATALGSRGRVYALEAPHTQENYLLQEMGYRIARRHAQRLRLVARIAGFALPALGSIVAAFAGGAAGVIASGLAVASAALGIVVERWLFFAEAKHTVPLYYGAAPV
jgi:sulfite dehydrogenase (quinone) subunit SoeC